MTKKITKDQRRLSKGVRIHVRRLKEIARKEAPIINKR